MGLIFVAGAGTEVGKTYVAAALVRRRRAAGRRVLALKPVASGLEAWDAPGFAASDTAQLLAAQGLPVTEETVAACSPWRFRAPLSPDAAARAEGRGLGFAEVMDWCRRRLAAAAPDEDVLVEGVGGVMSPMAEDALNLDWMAALRCPVVLVCGVYLGGISHALTAVEALRGRGLAPAAVVLNAGASGAAGLEDAAAALRRFGGLNPLPLAYGGAPPAAAWPD